MVSPVVLCVHVYPPADTFWRSCLQNHHQPDHNASSPLCAVAVGNVTVQVVLTHLEGNSEYMAQNVSPKQARVPKGSLPFGGEVFRVFWGLRACVRANVCYCV